MKLGLLVVMAVMVLAPSLSEGRIVSKCELKEKLWKSNILPKWFPKRHKEHILAIVICELNRRSHLNTSQEEVLGQREMTTTTPTMGTTEAMKTQATTTEEMSGEEMFTEEMITEEKFTEEKFTEEKFTEEKFTEEMFTEEMITEEKFTEEKFTEEKFTEEMTSEKMTSEEMTSEKMTTEAMTTNEMSSEEIITDKETTTQPFQTTLETGKKRRKREVDSSEMTTTTTPTMGTTEAMNTETTTTEEMSGKEMTTEEKFSEEMSSEEMTTEEKFSEEMSSEETTTEPFQTTLETGKESRKPEVDTSSEEYSLTATERNLFEMVNLLGGNFDEEEIEKAENRIDNEDDDSSEAYDDMLDLEEHGEGNERAFMIPKKKLWSLGNYGVFQLSDGYHCNSGHRWSINKCNTSCSAFADEDITDDINCFVKTGFWRRFLYESSGECSHTKDYFKGC